MEIDSRRSSKRPRASILISTTTTNNNNNNNNNNLDNDDTRSTLKKSRTKSIRKSSKPTWRPSLLDGTYKFKSLGKDLNRRINLVKGPASAALEGLLEIGNEDDSQADTGEDGFRLDNRRQAEFDAFEATKAAYLSPSLFLSATALVEEHPNTIQESQSPLNNLIKLANLTTFLYLVLRSAPTLDADGELTRSKESIIYLKDAIKAFFVHIVPEEIPIQDEVLKMLVGLICQHYLSTSSHSRYPPPPSTFFTPPLTTYLPASRNSSPPSLSKRKTLYTFQSYCAEATALMGDLKGDKNALERVWNWEELVGRIRSFCEIVGRGLSEEGDGSGSGSEVDEEEREERVREAMVAAADEEEEVALSTTKTRKSLSAHPDIFGGGSDLDSVKPEEEEDENEEEEEEEEMGSARMVEAILLSDAPQFEEQDDEEEEEEEEEADSDAGDVTQTQAQATSNKSNSRSQSQSESQVSLESQLAENARAAAQLLANPRDSEEEDEDEEEELDAGDINQTQRNLAESDSQIGSQISLGSQLAERAKVAAQLIANLDDESDITDDDEDEEGDSEEEESRTVPESQVARHALAGPMAALLDYDSDEDEEEEEGSQKEKIRMEREVEQEARELSMIIAKEDREFEEEESEKTPVPKTKDLRTIRIGPDARLARVAIDPATIKPGLFAPKALQVKIGWDTDTQESTPRETEVADEEEQSERPQKKKTKKVNPVDKKGKGRAISLSVPPPAPLPTSRTTRARSKGPVFSVAGSSLENTPPVEQFRSAAATSNELREMEEDQDQDQGYISDYGGGEERDKVADAEEAEREESDEDADEVDEQVARESMRRRLAKGKGKEARNDFLDKDDTAQDTLMADQDDRSSDFGLEVTRRQVNEPLSSTLPRSKVHTSTSRNQEQLQASTSKSSRKENTINLIAERSDSGIGEQSDSSDAEIIQKNRASKIRVEDSESDFDFDPIISPPRPPIHLYRRKRPLSSSPAALAKVSKRIRPHKISNSDPDSEVEENMILLAKPKNKFKTGRNVPGGRMFWTPKEEIILLEEMALFATDWKMIHARKGPEGFVNHTLSNWNANQLSNKARNIKTAKLKAGHEIPWFLNSIQPVKGWDKS